MSTVQKDVDVVNASINGSVQKPIIIAGVDIKDRVNITGAASDRFGAPIAGALQKNGVLGIKGDVDVLGAYVHDGEHGLHQYLAGKFRHKSGANSVNVHYLTDDSKTTNSIIIIPEDKCVASVETSTIGAASEATTIMKKLMDNGTAASSSIHIVSFREERSLELVKELLKTYPGHVTFQPQIIGQEQLAHEQVFKQTASLIHAQCNVPTTAQKATYPVNLNNTRQFAL